MNMITKNGTYVGAKGGTEMQFEGLISRLPKELLDDFQIICSRVRNLESNKKKILWLHDHQSDPENHHLADPELRKRFSKLVFVSYSQFLEYRLAYNLSYAESIVMRNCIEPFPAVIEKPDPKEKLNLIYHTTPHRGLEILVPVFEFLAKKYPNIHLDVFSSFNIYGWSERDKPYEEIFNRCRNHPQITYHGTQPNEKVREYLEKAHIFAYPSIWPETSCIAVIEAMAAQAGVVCSDLGALPETTMGNALMYHFHEDPNTHANIFAHVLENAIVSVMNHDLQNRFTHVAKSAMINYNWDSRIVQWTNLLESINNE